MKIYPLSSEQELVHEWERFSGTFSNLGARFSSDVPSLSVVMDALARNVGVICVSERYFRRAERCRELGIRPGTADDAEEVAHSLDEMGRAAIPRLIDLLRQVRTEDDASGRQEPSSFGNLDEAQEAFKVQLSDLEIKKTDVRKVDDKVTEIVNTAKTNGGGRALLDFCQQQLGEIENLRAQPDRGMSENIPFLKLIIFGVFAALIFYVMIRCAWNQSCWNRSAAGFVLFLGYSLGLIFASGCPTFLPGPNQA